MQRHYTNDQLSAVCDLINIHGHLYYHMGSALEVQYFKLCGDRRASGALYMVAWRMERGDYRHRGFSIKKTA
jgi:hypothetical protein